MLQSYSALQGQAEMVLHTQASAIQEKSYFPNVAFPPQQQGDSLAPGLLVLRKLFSQLTRWAARGGGGDEIKMSAYLRVGVKAEEYMLLVPDQMEEWEQKQHPTKLKMDAGAGAVNSQLSGKRSLSRSDAGSEEATFVSHFVLLYLSCSLPCCYDKSCLQIIAPILFSSVKNQAHTTLEQKGSAIPSSFSDNTVHMWLKRDL